jgi:agmatine deiminase
MKTNADNGSDPEMTAEDAAAHSVAESLPLPTPAELGFRHPAEWEPHESTWIAWPHEKDDWPGKFGPVPWVFADIVQRLSRSERVDLIVPGRKRVDDVAEMLTRAGAELDNVVFHEWKTDRGWLRDSLPTFLVRQGIDDPEVDPMGSRRAAVCWKFNAWAKYENHGFDAKLPRRVAKTYALDRFKPFVYEDESRRRVVLEGGAIDTNGQGVLLTTEECLLSETQCRNPGLTRDDYDRLFAETLAIEQVIWLGQGIVGDDTHGHVDDLARFVAHDTVVTVVESNENDVNFVPLAENLRRLKAARVRGKALNVIELPMPRPVVFDGQRLPASYANFYVANKIVLVPTFNDPADRLALATLADVFSDREVVGIHSLDLVWGLGALHCLAHEMPAVPPLMAPIAEVIEQVHDDDDDDDDESAEPPAKPAKRRKR